MIRRLLTNSANMSCSRWRSRPIAARELSLENRLLKGLTMNTVYFNADIPDDLRAAVIR
jgi:hypothetical protein